LHIVRGTYSGYLFLRVRTEVASRYPPLGEEDPRLYNPTSQNAVKPKFAENPSTHSGGYPDRPASITHAAYFGPFFARRGVGAPLRRVRSAHGYGATTPPRVAPRRSRGEAQGVRIGPPARRPRRRRLWCRSRARGRRRFAAGGHGTRPGRRRAGGPGVGGTPARPWQGRRAEGDTAQGRSSHARGGGDHQGPPAEGGAWSSRGRASAGPHR
jgi:hypothetical protein